MNKNLILLIAVLALSNLSACDSKENQARVLDTLSKKTFTTTSYNYTPYGLYAITFKDLSRPFKIDDAPGGGSVFVRDASFAALDNGDKIPFTTGNCCFIWDKPLDKPLRVKVIWNVVIDPAYYDGKSSVSYDERTSRESAPGTRWCEAVVDIAPASGGVQADSVVLHFLEDGSVQAQLASSKSDGPLPASVVKAHAANLPEGQFCKQEISNPFYGVQRAPHRE